MNFYKFINFDAFVMANGDCILFLPNSGNNGFAKFALITDQIIGGNVITLAFYQQFFAVVAIGVIPFVARHITEIYIADSLLQGQFPEPGKG